MSKALRISIYKEAKSATTSMLTQKQIFSIMLFIQAGVSDITKDSHIGACVAIFRQIDFTADDASRRTGCPASVDNENQAAHPSNAVRS
jgi:hypothetical protein